MKLKQSPEDFRVREVLAITPTGSGPYFLHLLHKEKLDTQSALGIVARRAGVGRDAIAFAGLKDRQGLTAQWISIRGKRLDWNGEGVSVRFITRHDQPVTSKLSGGNRFRIVVRDLAPADAVGVRRSLPSLRQSGFPNYFDDQRFGCLRHGQGFAMRAILAGDYEQALSQLVATPSRVAITGDVKLKRALQRHWGDWEGCARVARGPIYGRVFQHLLDAPADFRGALERLPVRMKLIHAFAYQSFLWNSAVCRWLRRRLDGEPLLWVPHSGGRLPVWRYLRPDQAAAFATIDTPLYGPDGDHGAPSFAAATESVLESEGLTSAAFREHALPGMVLRSEARALVVHPVELEVSDPARDERNAGRLKLELSFTLPRGSYATLLIKRLFADQPRARASGERPPLRTRDITSRPRWQNEP